MSENRRTATAGVKLLVFVAVASLLTGMLGVAIANRAFGPTTEYRAVFTDATSLLEGDEVRVSGVRVGQVTGIELKDGTHALVSFTVEQTGPFVAGLPKSTRAQIRYRNLIGTRYLALSEGAGTPGEMLKAGDALPLGQTTPALDLTVLFNGFRPLFSALEPGDVNQLSMEIIKVLQGEGGTINSLLSHVASLTNTLADRDEVIGRVITNLSEVLGTVSDRTDQTNRLVRELNGFVSGVSGDRTAIFDALDSLNTLSDVTANLLVDARPSLKTDIDGLNELTRTFADNGKVLDTNLGETRERLEKLGRTSSYGSWFNYYLCSMDARIVLPGAPAYYTPKLVNDNARCKQ
ncbi:phospholipid/cholesterol/gamma-HCH transport system substrate-binding protein [Actinocorallia herbida]|uniref:Phospholipid/cholesterol/gamma-HCH transport system substrate-binding protein n=1 Tax=Actinocorallia herbida TaxID=58109 RepID=A0A3N1DDE8_9ACTN|nr:MCE family protein [Actinocorallia herbida]ROO91188.1 phospholipid/cholesterol/gamma-HCH transport system substrate-binding protein [Actinocorallia herbida]